MKLKALLTSFSAVALTFGATAVLSQSASAPVPAAIAARDTSRTPVLTRAQFDQLLAQPQQLLIIDVRRPDEITKIGGFPAYLSVQLADLEQNLPWIPKDRAIVTVSNHAARAGRAGDLLTAHGFKVVGRIGVQTYEEAGGQLTRIAPKQTAR
jgi:rhodanese-related sulfurtransferase